MAILGIFVFILAINVSVFAHRLEVSVLDKGSGFFLKPFYPFRNNATVEEWPFVAVVGAHQVRAQFGPSYEAYSDISQKTLHQAISNHSSLLNFHLINGHEVSAHLVTETVISSRPRLQVLFHAGPAAESPVLVQGTTGRISPTETTAEETAPNLCLVLFAFKDNEVLTSTCTILDPNRVCIADLALPLRWWSDRFAQTVDVFYSVYNHDQNGPCGSELQVKRYGRYSWNDRQTFLAAVTLTHGQMNYQELKEDQHILIYVPTASFYPGSKFRVPVKLQAESDLEIFVIKVKVKHGIKVVGAEAKNGSRWTINIEVNARKQSAMVTAYVLSKETYTKTDRVQDIFDWMFEVDGDLNGSDQGRLSFSLEYEMTSKKKETYGSIENKAVARIQIQQDNTFAIVPVIKTTELINTAVLTGEVQMYPLSVYSVSHAGKIQDITLQTMCHSGDEDVLQAMESCKFVYLNGKESKGSSSVSVIAKFGRHTRFLFFRVWIPELPLDIDLSDNKLNLVSGWKVPLYGGFSRKSTVTDASISLSEDKGRRKEDLSLSCQLRYQSALVEVYTRFVMSDITQNPYMLHRKAVFRVTDFVRNRLHVVDKTVAQLRGCVVDGVKPGKTDIQVLSVSGFVLGTREIKVSSDRVNIQKLEVNAVSGLDLTIGAKLDFPGAIAARVVKQKRLTRKNQEAYLDIGVRFDDDALVPLHALPTSDYTLEADEVNTTIVKLSPLFSTELPLVAAVASGSGDLVRARFMSSSACPAPKSRTLASGHASIDISIINDVTQNDAGHIGYGNNGRNLPNGGSMWVDGGSELAADEKRRQKGKNGRNKPGGKSPHGRQSESGQVTGPDEEPPRIEAQKQPISEVQGMTSLEMAMYVLLALFCIAIVVFTANCMLFVARHRRKLKEKETKDPVSEVQDWVWIGRETLERNAVVTTCSQTLMPDADFNGNHSMGCMYLAPPGSGSGGGGSNRQSRCSNRSSQVSTYQGSECSIRITANLIPDNNGNTLESDAEPPLPPVRYLLPPPKRALECQTVKEEEPFGAQNCSDVKMEDEAMEEHGSPPHSSGDSQPLIGPKPAPSASTGNPTKVSTLLSVSSFGPRSTLSREERLRQLEEAVASGSDIEWDYEELGMTYEELMEYFDNLKESSA